MNKRLPYLRSYVSAHINELVKENNLVEACLLLIDLTEVCSPSYRGDAIVLTGRVNKLQKEKILGVVDYKTMTEENTRIANSIIMLVESISPLNIVS